MKNFFSKDDGIEITEYGAATAVVVIGLVITLIAYRDAVERLFNNLSDTVF